MEPTPEAVVSMVRSELTDDLRKKPWKGHPNPMAGHCYVASEAVFHLLGGFGSLWRPKVLRVGPITHWWLEDRITGEVVDATSDQFVKAPDYSKGRFCGFLTNKPSQRAAVVLERIGIRYGVFTGAGQRSEIQRS